MKKAIVAVSFGVGDIQVKERCLDALLADVREAFQDFEVYEAWTSSFLRKKMAREGYVYPSLEELLEELSEAGFADVVIMPTHLTPGRNFRGRLCPGQRLFLIDLAVCV